MYAVMRSYKVESGDLAEFERKVQGDFVPLISRSKGFRDYFFVQTGSDMFTTISVFDDADGAKSSIRLAADWVRSYGSGIKLSLPEVKYGLVTCDGHQPFMGETAKATAEVPAFH